LKKRSKEFQEKTSFPNTPLENPQKPMKNYCVQFGGNFALKYSK
jgi:hypothetical protein